MASAGVVQNLTFVSMTGPTLDVTNARAMRAHTTKANFARRRRRLVQEYHEQQEKQDHASRVKPVPDVESRELLKPVQPIHIQSLIPKQPSVTRKLKENDALLIDNLVHRLGKLHLTAEDLGLEDTQLMVWKSDWVRFLAFDPMMLNVSLYFAVYAARMRDHALNSAMEVYKGRALRSVRERLDVNSSAYSDSMIAAILLLTVTDQVTVNIEGWKMHITGLVKIIEIRSQDKANPPTHWITLAIPRTVLQGLILFSRRDPTVLTAIEKTGMLDTMFTPPAKEAVYLILESSDKMADLTESHLKNDTLSNTEIASTKHLIASLDAAEALSLTGSEPEAFLAAISLAMKIFIDFTVQHTTAKFRTDTSSDVLKLIEVLKKPEQRLCSSLALCSSLGLVFWISMMGAIASNDPKSKEFFMHRLEKTTVALSLATWRDAEAFLGLFAYIPTVLAVPCFETLEEVLGRRGFVLVASYCTEYLEKYKALRYRGSSL